VIENSRQNRRNCAAGMSLVEVLVTLAVMGIVTAIAVPNFQQFIQRLAIDSERIELQNMFMLARSEAVKRSQQVWIGSSQGNWQGDLVAFVDLNEDFVRQDNEPIVARVSQQKQIVIEPSEKIAPGIGYAPVGSSYSRNTTNTSVAGNGHLDLKAPGYVAAPNSYVGTICVDVNGRTSLRLSTAASTEKVLCK
jgi:type IV fimbrial biogenesis protein FimT